MKLEELCDTVTGIFGTHYLQDYPLQRLSPLASAPGRALQVTVEWMPLRYCRVLSLWRTQGLRTVKRHPSVCLGGWVWVGGVGWGGAGNPRPAAISRPEPSRRQHLVKQFDSVLGGVDIRDEFTKLFALQQFSDFVAFLCGEKSHHAQRVAHLFTGFGQGSLVA